MTWMLLTSILLVALYVGAAIWKQRVLPRSISALVYVLPPGRWRWLWSAWLAVVTLLMAPALTAALATAWWTSLLADATIVCLAMTAALPLLPGYHNRLHTVLGIAAGVLSQACVVVVGPLLLLLWLPFVAVCIWIATSSKITALDGKGVLLAEVVCTATVYAACFYYFHHLKLF